MSQNKFLNTDERSTALGAVLQGVDQQDYVLYSVSAKNNDNANAHGVSLYKAGITHEYLHVSAEFNDKRIGQLLQISRALNMLFATGYFTHDGLRTIHIFTTSTPVYNALTGALPRGGRTRESNSWHEFQRAAQLLSYSFKFTVHFYKKRKSPTSYKSIDETRIRNLTERVKNTNELPSKTQDLDGNLTRKTAEFIHAIDQKLLNKDMLQDPSD